VEYTATGEDKALVLRSSGADFYADTKKNARLLVFSEDQEYFLSRLDKTAMLETLARETTFTVHYRLMIEGKPLYHSIKAVRGTGADDCYLIIGVRNIDAEKRRLIALEAEQQAFGEIAYALARRYEVIYHVNVVTGSYVEYSSSPAYAQLQCGVTGTDFFADTQRNMLKQIYEEDLPMMQHAMQREVLLGHMTENRSTTLNYRLLLGGEPQYVTLFAIRPQEDSEHIIVAVANVDAAKRREIEFRAALGSAMAMASRDALTGVKNKHAYAMAEDELDHQINAGTNPDFAVVVCDINGLKTVNDTFGHSAGDEFIKAACHLICTVFKHSPVFRIGGDEFTVLLKGQDLEHSKELMENLAAQVEENGKQKLVTVASGISHFDPKRDGRMQDVFERADSAMYECKKIIKERFGI